MDFAFITKKLISAAIMPLSITLLLLLFGLLFLYANNIKKAKLFLTFGFISLILMAYQPFANYLLEPLETTYTKLKKIPNDVTHILLLGGDMNNRTWEAVRLYKLIKNAKIITSGYKGNQNIPEAIRTANLLQEIGIPKKDIIIHSQPKDTKEEAIKTKKLLGDKTFILVTSAYHMPRAIALFTKEGLNPIPAPADIKVKNTRFNSIPQGRYLQKTELALHEYLGLIWATIKGQI